MRPPESFVGQPIRSLQTMLHVIFQAAGEKTALIPDGIYGPETMQAVSAFQRSHGLPITGIADLCTWEAVSAAYPAALQEIDVTQPIGALWNPGQVIRSGENHPNFQLAQGMLSALSKLYHSISQPTQSGTLDEATADSLSSFQMLSGLPMTGQLDRRTWEFLSRQYPLASNLQQSGRVRPVGQL